MSDVSKTNKKLIAELRRSPSIDLQTVIELMAQAANALEAATRVPAQGEPGDDRENLITERTYGHGSITLTHYRSSGRIGVVQRGKNSVMDVTDLLVFLQDSGLDEVFSRATVPDAATGNVQKMYDRACADIQEYSETIKRLQAEREAAVAAIERVTAERDAAMARIAKAWELHKPFIWSFGHGPVQSCKWCADHGVSQEVASWPCPTIAALEGAPEPEWEYGFELIEPDDRNVFEREGDFISAAFAYRAAKKRIDEEHQADLPRLQYLIVRRRKAGPWLPVEGESKS